MCRQFTELKKSSRSFYLCSCLVEVFFEAVNLFGDLFGILQAVLGSAVHQLAAHLDHILYLGLDV